jgi:hypothetical protein
MENSFDADFIASARCIFVSKNILLLIAYLIRRATSELGILNHQENLSQDDLGPRGSLFD